LKVSQPKRDIDGKNLFPHEPQLVDVERHYYVPDDFGKEFRLSSQAMLLCRSKVDGSVTSIKSKTLRDALIGIE